MELPAWRGADLPHPFQTDLMEAQLTECLSLESSNMSAASAEDPSQ
jgi:hypothetical protein